NAKTAADRACRKQMAGRGRCDGTRHQPRPLSFRRSEFVRGLTMQKAVSLPPPLDAPPSLFRTRLREAGQKKILEQRRAAKTSKRQKHCAHKRLLEKRSKGTVAQFFYSTRQQFKLSGKPVSILRLSDRHDSIIQSPKRPGAQGLRRQSQCYGAAADDE